MKKILMFVLSFGIVLSTCINVGAISPKLDKTNVAQNTIASMEVDETKFITMHPGDIGKYGGSASVIYNSFSAQRQADGSIVLIIEETFHSVRGYYEHMATDLSGENFISNKNTAYYTPDEGVYSVTLPSDTVSADGYVYIKFAIAPEGGDAMFYQDNLKIPVDYDSHKVVADDYYSLNIGEKFTAVFSAQLAVFDAKATRQNDNSVEVIINIDNSNTPLWFNHKATSKDGDIFIPQKDTWYNLGSGTQTNKSYRFVLPEKNVSADGCVYLNVCFNLPFGMYESGHIKLSIL